MISLLKKHPEKRLELEKIQAPRQAGWFDLNQSKFSPIFFMPCGAVERR
jgi:hypothetical protein